MALSTKYLSLLCVACCLVVQAIHAATLAPPTYNAANIVPNIETDCPVKNVPFDKSVFDAESLLTMPDVLTNGGVSQKCQDAAFNDLASCLSDGSLQVMSGCCATECATAIKKNVASGCFVEYQKAICNDPKAAKVQTGLFYAAKRCGNYEATCGPNKTATATTANTTAAAANTNSTTAANTTTAALPAASTAANRSADGPAALTASPAAATHSNAAESKAVSIVVSFVGAVAAFVLAIAY